MAAPDPALVARIEAAALWAWPPRETRYLHGWLLRAGAAGTRRVNSAQTLAFAALPDRLDAALREAAAWYAARGRPACYQLTEVSAPAGLDAELAARGLARVSPTLVMTADPAGFTAAAPDGPVELLHRPGQAVLNAMADPHRADIQRRERAALLARIRRPHRFGLVAVGGEPAAGGLVVLDPPTRTAGLFALRTQAPFRRQGLGRRLLAALAGWARSAGAGLLYLQVEEANETALPLYVAAGFAPAYRYWYREVKEC